VRQRVFVFLFPASVCFLLLIGFVAGTYGQTAATGTVVGTVIDPGGAAVPDATVTLQNKATNNQANQITNSAGYYTFANVAPGNYRVTIKKDGFRSATVEDLKVEVAKSFNVDVKLEIGQVTESVTVTTEARVELQTTDAQMGDVVGGTTLVRLPTLQRDASELLTLQPGTTPYDTPANGGFGNNGGTVAGARSDQNSISLDGIDITDNTVGGGATAVNFIPTGVESLDEFKVGVTNANAMFGRSSGGEIVLVSKGGTNTFHGDAYWFHQSDGYNANSWDLNHTADANGNPFTRKTPFKDNRGGFSVGGPIVRDKTFIFGNYEVRRFPAGQTVTHIVPTDSLRDGVLQFKDCAQGFDSNGNCLGGNVIPYDLASSTLCGPGANTACDPRHIGISPTLQTLFRLNPGGNDPSVVGTDTLNTTGFRGTVTTPIKNDFVTARLDHNFTDRIHFFGKYLYSRSLQVTPTQINTLNNTTTATSGLNTRGDGAIGSLDYAFNNNLSNVVRFGWIRSRITIPGLSPSTSAAQLALDGTNTDAGFVALAPGLAATGFLDVPIDVDTQRARTQANFQRNKQFVDDLTWIKGRHTITAGFDVRWLPIIAERNDKVISSLSSLVATMDADAGGSQKIPAINRPPTCSPAIPASGGNPAVPAVLTNCLLPADVQRWDRFYAATLGIVDNVSVLAVRDGSLNPLPFGTSLIANTTSRAYDFYAQDTWRIRPSLTLTYGLTYGWQTPPHDNQGKQTFIVDASNNQILTGNGYINDKHQAALNGQAFNPTIGYLPIKNSGRSDIYDVDYGSIGPRASLAWSPSYSGGILGHLFGSGKTVIRAGFGVYYDRINNVQSVEIPQLGVGFAQTLVLKSPLCNATGAGGPSCNPGAGGANLGLSGFRTGVDGTLPVPAFPAVSSPVVPDIEGEILSFSLDPDFKVGRSYSSDLTIQRELPGNMLLEVGYISRLGRELPNSVDFDSSPFMLKDQGSGQTFAQAWDAVQAALTTGGAVPDQPWFENQLAGIGALSVALGGCGSATLSATQCLLAQDSGDFQARSVNGIFTTMGFDRLALGRLPYNSLQVALALFVRTHRDISNYNAATITLRKRPSHGLQFDLNYTYSRSLDQVGQVQNSAGTYATSFNRSLQYGPSLFDRTHIFNAIFNYDLPAGKGHRFSFRNGIADKFIAGWYVSGVFRANSGAPLVVVDGDVGGGPFSNTVNAIPLVSPDSIGGGAHRGVTGTTFGSGGNVNLFSDPDKAAADFRPFNLSTDGRDGTGNPLRGLGLWNLDARLGKVTSFHERFKVEFSADFFNLFNHVNFFDPTLNLNNPANFGVISTQLIPANRQQGSRWIQLGLRVSF
jgi:carboxypeptidase family protein